MRGAISTKTDTLASLHFPSQRGRGGLGKAQSRDRGGGGMGEDNRGTGEEEGWERDHCGDHYGGMKGEQLWDGGWGWMRDRSLCH